MAEIARFTLHHSTSAHSLTVLLVEPLPVTDVPYFHRLLETVARERGASPVHLDETLTMLLFGQAQDAVVTAQALYEEIRRSNTAEGLNVAVRMALHTDTREHVHPRNSGPAVEHCISLLRLANRGQIILSQSTASSVQQHLPVGMTLKGLGVHRLHDLFSSDNISQLVNPEWPEDFAPLHSLSLTPNNLPTQLTRFIGRAPELMKIQQLLNQTRILTITGPGGTGKSRLALQAGASLLSKFPSGVWLVDVGTVQDRVVSTIATTLGIPTAQDRAESTLSSVVERLHEQTSLLILDNCDHHIAACVSLIHHLLQTCPQLRIMVTSREVLRATGEVIFRLPSLKTPDPACMPPLEEMLDYEAICLFLDRARRVLPGFTLTHRNVFNVAAICRELEGTPRAIEMAAGLLNLLSPAEILRRLDGDFVQRAATAPGRNHCEDSMNRSHAVLSKPHRMLWRRLSVFSGSFTLTAAEQICAETDQSASAVLEGIGELADRSLVVVEPDCYVTRFRLPFDVRQFGLKKLREASETEALKVRHRDWYLRWVEHTSHYLNGPEQADWLKRLQLEYANICSALKFSVSRNHAAEAFRLANAMGSFWLRRGPIDEGQTYMEEVLAIHSDLPSLATASLLCLAGRMAQYRGQHETARSFFQQTAAHAKLLGSQVLLAYARGGLGATERALGKFSTARAYFDQAMQTLHRLKDQHGTEHLKIQLAFCWLAQGKHHTAEQLFEEVLLCWKHQGDLGNLAMALVGMGVIADRCGRPAEAGQLFQRSLELFRQTGETWGVALVLRQLANAAVCSGDYTSARNWLCEALRLQSQSHQDGEVLATLRSVAWLESACGQPVRAARLFGAVNALSDAQRRPFLPLYQRDHDHYLCLTRQNMDEEQFRIEWARGSLMGPSAAIEFALEQTDEARTAAPSSMCVAEPVPAPNAALAAITERELAVVRLVAQGFTRKEMARALFVSPKTVDRHLQNIYDKLSLTPRSKPALVAWASHSGVLGPEHDSTSGAQIG